MYNPPLRKMLWLSLLTFGAPVYVWWAHDWLVADMHQNLPPYWFLCIPAALMLFGWTQWLWNLRSVNRTER